MKIKHFLITVLMLMLALPAHAELEINVRGASRNPMPIAIPEMLGNTSNIFSAWCRMLGGQLFLLIMNAWCLRLFVSMVGTFLANPLSV